MRRALCSPRPSLARAARPAPTATARPARTALRLRASVEDGGYESASDENVATGKGEPFLRGALKRFSERSLSGLRSPSAALRFLLTRPLVKAVSRMTLAELRVELEDAGLDGQGTKPELVSRVRAARSSSSKKSPAAFAPAAVDETTVTVSDLASQVATLESGLAATESLAKQAGEKADEALAFASAAVAAAPAPGVPLVLRVVCKLCFGENLLAVGSHAGLGAWDVSAGAQLLWTEGDIWTAEAALPLEGRVELKFVVRRGSGSLVWQAGDNLVLETAPSQRTASYEGSYPPGQGRAGPLIVYEAHPPGDVV